MIQEWKNLFKNRFLIIALVAIITVPTIYTTLFLGSMWDPYGKVENLPVAIVNLDKPVTYKDKNVNVGEELVENLREKDSLDFSFVSKEAAEAGLKDGDYYMVITIPENFSNNAITLLDKNPEKMVLKYDTNPGTNYIASKMSSSALQTIQKNVSATVTKTYAETVFDKLKEINDGFYEAADGSSELEDGLKMISDGNSEVRDGLSKLSNSMLTFTDGIHTFSDGLDTYLDGVGTVNTGAKKLATGAGTLAAGLSKLNDAAAGISLPEIALTEAQKKTISSTASGAVSPYADKLSKGIGSAVASSINGTLTSQTTISTISTAVLNDSNVKQMVTVLTMAGYTKEQAESLVTGIISSSLNGAAGNITGASITNAISNSVSSTMSTVAGTAAVSGAQGVIEQVNTSMSSYGPVFSKLSSSVSELSKGANELSTGASTLADGTKKLDSKKRDLKKGVSSLNDGANQIIEGVDKLYDGTLSLTDGLDSAVKGAGTLKDNLSDAGDTLDDSIKTVSDDTYEMFAAPVESKETQVTSVPNNGHAMACYMMAVASWIGAMGFCMIYPLKSSKKKAKNGFTLWLSKASVMFPVSCIWSVVMVFALRYINGFKPENIGLVILTACIASAAFISIVYFLNVVFGKAASYFILILMVLQLSASAGTYPVELSGSFVEKITNYLPYTHAIKAFRIGVGGGTGAESHLYFLLAVTVIFIVMTVGYFWYDVKKNEDVEEMEYELEGAVE